MYLMLGTRPDVAYSMSRVSQFASNPDLPHWHALRRIFAYIKTAPDLGITYQAGPPPRGWTDSDYAGDVNTRRSTTGYLFQLSGGPISWASTKQKTIALSTCEAEYMAACEGVKEAIWLKGLSTSLGYSDVYPESITVYGDNQGAIDLSHNPEHHKQTKHIDIRYHWLREQIARGHVNYQWLPTGAMAADGLTKPLTPDKFTNFIKLIGLERWPKSAISTAPLAISSAESPAELTTNSATSATTTSTRAPKAL